LKSAKSSLSVIPLPRYGLTEAEARQIVSTIIGVHIDFDPTKNATNVRERDLDFQRANEFDWGTAQIEQDIRKHYPEPRFVAVGYLALRLHVLCFTPVAGGIRVISFRKANKREVKDYDQTRTLN
jgi:uncharacterized protein